MCSKRGTDGIDFCERPLKHDVCFGPDRPGLLVVTPKYFPPSRGAGALERPDDDGAPVSL